jgi:lysyl-tRNA synthetase class 1
MKWRIDWPARWSYEKVIFEPGGIDHSAPGGSYTTAKEISKEIFNYESPIYVFYDWIKPKGGTEFSSSKGNVFTIQEVEDIYEPSVLRFLFAGTRPNKGFEISFDNDVIKIYEDFDELERKYYDKKADLREKRIYEMSVLKLSKTKPSRISFRHMITMIQTGKTKNLGKENKIRAEKVANWLKHYGKEMGFEIQEKINVKLTEKQKDALIKLRETLSKKEINEEKLFNEFYKISESAGIPTKEFFEISYKVIIGKSRGPRLASLIFSAGKEKVIKLLKQI